MEHFLAQPNLLAQGDDAEKWMNILILVVLAAFWAIANLVRTKKLQQDREQEQSSGRPARKPSTPVSALRKAFMEQLARPAAPVRYRPQARQRPPTAVRPHPVMEEPTPKKEEPEPTPAAAPLEKSKLPSLATALGPGLEQPPDMAGKPVEGLQAGYGPAATHEVEYEPAFEFLLDYEDPDQLRRAILHYEILGKPLSLRGGQEHIIGL